MGFATVNATCRRRVGRCAALCSSQPQQAPRKPKAKGGLGKGAVKAAYRSASLSVHPDKNRHPRAQDAFDAVQEAYETLSDPNAAALYDRSLRRAAEVARQRVRRRVLERVESGFGIVQYVGGRALAKTSECYSELTEFARRINFATIFCIVLIFL